MFQELGPVVKDSRPYWEWPPHAFERHSDRLQAAADLVFIWHPTELGGDTMQRLAAASVCIELCIDMT